MNVANIFIHQARYVNFIFNNIDQAISLNADLKYCTL